MFGEQRERAALRRQGCLLKGTWYVFAFAFFLVFIVGAIYLHPALLSLVPATLFLLAGGIPLSLISGRMKQKEWEWLQQYGTAIQVPVIGIEKKVSVRGQQPTTRDTFPLLAWICGM